MSTNSEKSMSMDYRDLCNRLAPLYNHEEASAIVRLVAEKCFRLTWADLLCGRLDALTDGEKERLGQLVQRLETGEPVQYVLGEADFGGRSFHVEPGVLIPRPETWELCQWIIDQSKTEKTIAPRILDIGTGSGCIAVTMALSLPHSCVTAWDISDDALRVARLNAHRLAASVTFERQDALRLPSSSKPSPQWNIIVSNPPYICRHERAAMASHVTDHEPHEALFVPDEAPLLFYRHIAIYAQSALAPDGSLYFEINPLYAEATAQMLAENGFQSVELRHDQFGKERFVHASECHPRGFVNV